MMLAIVFVIMFATGVASQHGRLIGIAGSGDKFPFDIHVKKDGSIIAVSGQPEHPNPSFKQSINLYDLEKKLEARKIIEGDVCFIRKTKGNLGHINKLFSSKHLTVSEEADIPGEEIKPEELEQTVGAKIANFCSGYKVFWAKNPHKKSRKVKRGWWRGARGNAGSGGTVGVSVGSGETVGVSVGVSW